MSGIRKRPRCAHVCRNSTFAVRSNVTSKNKRKGRGCGLIGRGEGRRVVYFSVSSNTYVTNILRFYKINTLYCSYLSIRQVLTIHTHTPHVHTRARTNPMYERIICNFLCTCVFSAKVMLGAHQVSGTRVSQYTFKCTIYDDYLCRVPSCRVPMTRYRM